MGLFASNGTLEKTYSDDVDAVRTAITEYCREQGHHLGSVSQDQMRFEVSTKRTAMNWGTAVVLTLTPTGSGTKVVIDYDNVDGSPRALMDGRKNTKTITKFVDGLSATLHG